MVTTSAAGTTVRATPLPDAPFGVEVEVELSTELSEADRSTLRVLLASNDVIGRGIHQQFHKRACVAAGKRRLHRTKCRFVDIELCQALACLSLRQSYDAYLRFGEDCRRHVGVIDRRRLAAEYRISESVTFADCHGGKIDAVCNVANCIDIGNRSP